MCRLLRVTPVTACPDRRSKPGRNCKYARAGTLRAVNYCQNGRALSAADSKASTLNRPSLAPESASYLVVGGELAIE